MLDLILGGFVEFRLIYKGKLKASTPDSRRTDNKHEIRKVIHKQLAQLYKEHQALRDRGAQGTKTFLEQMADTFGHNGFRFVPLVNESQALVCSLDILFLRRESPGHILSSGGGDIDRRIVTFLDGLRVPKNRNELPSGAVPTADENPMFCLLQDDSLVTELRVETDRLLTAPDMNAVEDVEDAGHPQNDVMLIVHTRVRATRLGVGNIDFLAI